MTDDDIALVRSLDLPQSTDWKIGDLVKVSEFSGFPAWTKGVVYKITKRPARSNEVNYIAEPADGVGRGLRGPNYSFVAHDGPAPETVATAGCPPNGTVVRFIGPGAKAGLYVVHKQSPDGKSGTVLHLNGDGSGYRNVQGSRLERVEVVAAP